MLRRHDRSEYPLKRRARFVYAKRPSGLLEPLGLLNSGHLSLWLSLQRSLRFFGHTSPSRSRSIGETLANDALERLVGTCAVVHTERNPVVVPEIELGKVAIQMLPAAMLINAGHSALEDAEEAFDGVALVARSTWKARASPLQFYQ